VQQGQNRRISLLFYAHIVFVTDARQKRTSLQNQLLDSDYYWWRRISFFQYYKNIYGLFTGENH